MGAIGSHEDPAVTTNASGTVISFLRGLVTLVAARIPALGQALRAASIPVTIASDQPAIAVEATFEVGDIEIGAVELKNATTDDRAVVQTASSTTDATVGVAVADGNLHTSLGAVGAAADPDGVIHGQLRSIAENTDALPAALGSAADAASFPVTMSTEDKAKVPALGVALSAASTPVVLASDDAHLGAVGAAADVDGVAHAQLRYIGEAVDNIPAVGAANAAAALPVTLATDDAHLGAVGAASDVDGVLHAQMRYLAERCRSASPAAVTDSAAVGAASVESAGLDPGVFWMSSDVDLHYRRGATGGTAVTTDRMLFAGERLMIVVSVKATDGYVQFIDDGVAGRYWIEAQA